MKIAFVTAFPPSRHALNEYGFHIAQQLRERPRVQLTVLGDYLPEPAPELPGFEVKRCWGFERATNLVTLLRAIRSAKPDIVWYNLGFASFGAGPLSALLGLAAPAATRCCGKYTHVTLHQLFETVDLSDAGVRFPRLYRAGGWLATHLLLSANSLSVLLPAYRRILQQKYRRGRVGTRSHGIFAGRPERPDFSKRGNPEHRILAFGKWGTYKRLELLIEAFRRLSEVLPNATLVIAGGDHPKTPGYVASMAERYANARIRFLGYVPEDAIAESFRTASVTVMPYSSSAGSSGVAHLAAQYGVPVIASDIRDFRELAEHERIAIAFFAPGSVESLVDQLFLLLNSPERMRAMAESNFSAALQMTMPEVIRQYVQSFDHGQRLRTLQGLSDLRRSPGWFPGRESLARKWGLRVQSWEDDVEDASAQSALPSGDSD